jgi:hypothetical protein
MCQVMREFSRKNYLYSIEHKSLTPRKGGGKNFTPLSVVKDTRLKLNKSLENCCYSEALSFPPRSNFPSIARWNWYDTKFYASINRDVSSLSSLLWKRWVYYFHTLLRRFPWHIWGFHFMHASLFIHHKHLSTSSTIRLRGCEIQRNLMHEMIL